MAEITRRIVKKAGLPIVSFAARCTGGKSVTAPRLLSIEVTSVCNLHCGMCECFKPGSERRTIPHLTRQDFEAHIKPIPGKFRFECINLQGLGEPLLNPDLAGIIETARKRWPRAFITFNTNGLFLDRHAGELLTSGVDDICVSINSSDAAQFAEHKGGARLDDVLANIRGFLSKRGTLGKKKPVISFRTVAIKGVDVFKIVDTAREAGAVKVIVQELLVNEASPEQVRFACPLEEELRRLKRDLPGYARKRGVEAEILFPSIDPLNTCVAPWYTTYFLSDGQVMPCCVLNAPPVGVMGDWRHDRLDKIWNNSAYRSFRTDFIRGKSTPCLDCVYYQTWKR